MKSRFGLRIDRLTRLREEHGWSQRELAHICQLSSSMIHKYETGVSDPTAYTMVMLADKLGVSIDYLSGVTDDPHMYVRDTSLTDSERVLLETFRREGWSGVARLGVEQLSKPVTPEK